MCSVYGLAWDSNSSILYIGGIFDAIDNQPLSASLCQWTAAGGIQSFSGGGLSNSPIGSVYSQASDIAFEHITQVCF
jgi:hypothetical protein